MTRISRNASLLLMPLASPTSWTFLTSHARVLLCIARDPGIRLREIGERAGVTERAAHRIVGDLADAGYLSRERHGRRNRYTINSNLTLPDPVARRRRVGDLLALLTEPNSAPPAFDPAPAAS
jgi:MarR family